MAIGHFDNGEFRRAHHCFEQALQVRRAAPKASVSSADIRFWMHKCLVQLDDTKRALTVLSAVAAEDRTLEMHMALGRLNHKSGAAGAAKSALWAVLKARPLALEAVRLLIQLEEDMTAYFDGVAGLSETHRAWLRRWVAGHHAAAHKRYTDAVEQFAQLKDAGPDNPHVLVHLADWQWKQGNLPAGRQAFEIAFKADPLNLDRMDVFAHVLVAQGKEDELNTLCATLLQVDKNRIEPWLALARYYQLLSENCLDELQATKHKKQGLMVVERASQICANHDELHMVRGTLLLALDRPRDASLNFRSAYKLNRDFAAYQGLVMCYIAEGRMKEAYQIALDARRQLSMNPRAITLLGSVIKRSGENNDKARKLFKDALAINNECMDAVIALFELELEEENCDAAIKLLEPHLVHSRADYIHRRLADAHMMNSNLEMALKHYELALTINPSYEPAREGIVHATKALAAAEDGAGEPDELDDTQEAYD
eukprot:CAMPEP_0206289218 /NCGR_PEP_ID=MMETSP0106_2-20121207/2006_1 /ASSEMBLY_ACC=CAM_ASM_000206 /TAXON_ID=81532 /ORGANISM="Acanthoeca-like sp., Strain 10tr" /LENGTH=483 /DNA_ID=CAMNT_0053719771 /DNA_START=30 /DNA_END=1481 /DNA_ORIENTATION=+